jgi:hypothetical protein
MLRKVYFKVFSTVCDRKEKTTRSDSDSNKKLKALRKRERFKLKHQITKDLQKKLKLLRSRCPLHVVLTFSHRYLCCLTFNLSFTYNKFIISILQPDYELPPHAVIRHCRNTAVPAQN